MPRCLLKSAAVAGLSLLAYSAQANPLLPVTNLEFNLLATHSPATRKRTFSTSVKPVGWSTGAAGACRHAYLRRSAGLRRLSGRSGNVYGVYTNPGFSNTVPAGTNFFQADGNPEFESTIIQTISGLMAGTTYDP